MQCSCSQAEKLQWHQRSRRPPEHLHMMEFRIAERHLWIWIPNELAASAFIHLFGDFCRHSLVGPLRLWGCQPQDPMLRALWQLIWERVWGKHFTPGFGSCRHTPAVRPARCFCAEHVVKHPVCVRIPHRLHVAEQQLFLRTHCGCRAYMNCSRRPSVYLVNNLQIFYR